MSEAIPSHKVCSKCKQSKPRNCYYPEPRVSDGLQSQCNDCKAEYRKKYRSTQRGKEWNQKWARDYYQKKDRAVLKARDAITKNVYRKKLTKPDTCSRCGKTNTRIEAHHHKGYAYENRFDVVWLCSLCHNTLERNKTTVTD